MFAFALWDRKRRTPAPCARPIGKKPLFYSRRDGTLWFGSEAKAILQDPEVDREVDSRRDRLLPALPVRARIRSAPSPRSQAAAGAHARLAQTGGSTIAALLAALVRDRIARCRTRGGGAGADPRQAARGDAPAAAQRRPARRVPLRRRRLERGRRRDGAAVSRAGEDVLDRLRRRRVRRDRPCAGGRASSTGPSTTSSASSRRDGGPAAARLALRRAVRRQLGDPELLPRGARAPSTSRSR